MEKTVLSACRWEKGKSGKQAKIRAAYGINGTDAGCIAKNRLKDDAQSDTLLRDAILLGWSQRAGQVMAPQLQKVGDKKEATGAGTIRKKQT